MKVSCFRPLCVPLYHYIPSRYIIRNRELVLGRAPTCVLACIRCTITKSKGACGERASVLQVGVAVAAVDRVDLGERLGWQHEGGGLPVGLELCDRGGPDDDRPHVVARVRPRLRVRVRVRVRVGLRVRVRVRDPVRGRVGPKTAPIALRARPVSVRVRARTRARVRVRARARALARARVRA